MSNNYLTVAEELIGHADAISAFYDERGYRVKPEPRHVDYPMRPTFRVTRDQTTVFVDLQSGLRLDVVEEWCSYAKSCSKDTRVVIAVPAELQRTGETDQQITELGAGLLLCGDAVTELIVPRDQCINVNLPTANLETPWLQSVMGPVREKFDRGDWPEAFEEFTIALQNAAATYLKNGINSGRITLATQPGKHRALSSAQIDKLTLGALATAFSQIVKKNHADDVIRDALDRVNDDRVAIAHHRREAKTQRKLRANVNKHIWRMYHALKEISSAPGIK